MKKILITFGCLCIAVTSAFTQDSSESPTQTPTPNAITGHRLLVCAKNANNITFDICGVRGCPAVMVNKGQTTKYQFGRSKNSDGSLKYATRANSKPKCTVAISTLRQGVRRINSISCSSTLVGASCKFINR